MSTKYHIAQVNIAHLIAPQGDSRVQDFFDNVPPINELAENSEGFIWRYTDDYPDPLVAFNMSVWDSIESLTNYAYRSDHVKIFRRRDEWIKPSKKPHLALWWVVEGEMPTMQQGLDKLKLLDEKGPHQHAFTFANRFDPPS